MIKKTITDEVLTRAGRYVGTKEEKPNSGKKVNEFLASVGLLPGNPWCAAFCYFVIDRVLDTFNMTNPIQRTGYCPYLKTWAEMQKCCHVKPQAGDVFLLVGKREDGIRRAFHCGFVDEVNEDGTAITTIEGNTNIDGSAEGVGVFRRMRIAEPSGNIQMRYIRWVDKLPMGANPAEAPKQWTALLPDGGQLPLIRRDERLMVPVRAFGAAMGQDVVWDQDTQGVTYDGVLLPTELLLIKGISYAFLREVTEAMGWRLMLNGDKRTATVIK